VGIFKWLSIAISAYCCLHVACGNPVKKASKLCVGFHRRFELNRRQQQIIKFEASGELF